MSLQPVRVHTADVPALIGGLVLGVVVEVATRFVSGEPSDSARRGDALRPARRGRRDLPLIGGRTDDGVR